MTRQQIIEMHQDLANQYAHGLVGYVLTKRWYQFLMRKHRREIRRLAQSAWNHAHDVARIQALEEAR